MADGGIVDLTATRGDFTSPPNTTVTYDGDSDIPRDLSLLLDFDARYSV
jgi:hypothetical protein